MFYKIENEVFYVQLSLVLSEKELTEHRPCCKLNLKSLLKQKLCLSRQKDDYQRPCLNVSYVSESIRRRSLPLLCL